MNWVDWIINWEFEDEIFHLFIYKLLNETLNRKKNLHCKIYVLLCGLRVIN